MSKFKIERGHIAPPPRSRYPFNKMEVGDSVHVEGQDGQGRAAVAARGLAHYRRARGVACKFSVRPEGNGVRIWRVE